MRTPESCPFPEIRTFSCLSPRWRKGRGKENGGKNKRELFLAFNPPPPPFLLGGGKGGGKKTGEKIRGNYFSFSIALPFPFS